jgi:putative NADH-flavin reductase
MHLTVFGASGRTGKPLVEQALAAGHTVTAFVRDAARLPMTHERLQIVVGDVADSNAVGRSIEGADAVLSVIGHVKGSRKDIQTVATDVIIRAMQTHNVRRLISLTGAGVPAPQDQPKLLDRIIKLALQTLAGDVLRDALQHAARIKQSDRDWVIVRAPMLTDDPHTGNYRVGWVGVNSGPRVARADVADFMLQQVSDQTYLHQAPVVSA